ncbi:MAG: hypothetical protein Q8R98_14100, partial [Rubrivivax sp.]|nr:hypothetical protein [Rubrivivax sp.]
MQVGSTKGWLKLDPWPQLSSLALVLLAGLGAAQAAAVTQVTPQGEVGEVRQVSIRFDSAVVPAGDPRAAAPYTLQCNGSTPAGETRWLNERQWVYDLREPLASGQRCTLKPAAGFVPLGGGTGSTTSATPAGFKDYSFATGAPLVLQVQPWPGSTIEEDQHFLLRLNGAPDPASVRTSAWCEVEGLGERMPVR